MTQKQGMTAEQVTRFRNGLLNTIEGDENTLIAKLAFKVTLKALDKILSENTLPNVEVETDIYDMSDAD